MTTAASEGRGVELVPPPQEGFGRESLQSEGSVDPTGPRHRAVPPRTGPGGTSRPRHGVRTRPGYPSAARVKMWAWSLDHLSGGSHGRKEVVKDVQVVGDADAAFPAVDNGTARDVAFGVAVLCEESGDLPLEG